MRNTTVSTTSVNTSPEKRGLALELMRCMWRAQETDVSVPRTDAAASVVMATYAENAEVLRKTLAAHGWPGYRLVGERAARAAWYIAQYCSDLNLQEQALRLMERALRDDDASPEHYALLADRICLNRREPQRFGTLYIPDVDGRLVLYRVSEPARLDDRRHALGLGPHAVYESELKAWDAGFKSRS
ncbi:DUF6624 domain-containing protein [Streptomyces sp. SP17KL33]|uniref:DUF6624 domain-containing protein n=1 Tax=Streptomyces sp. SP17KL33 TaxID=3002534 RepID=UPI002E77528B|nr:DUF6624 domain-containing protein [Streptomyces sp. SP17KL33]MEE1829708.1 hypothetical protein [Streptomyces sp. SP17KL33]